MTIYYSPSKEGFYDTSVISYPSLPEDCIQVTASQRKIFLEQMNNSNKRLVAVDGNLRLEDRPIIVTWQSVRDKRNSLLNESDFTQIADYMGDKEAWATYRQELRDIPQNFDDPSEVVWPVRPNG